MQRFLSVLVLCLACAGTVRAQGHLVPTDQSIAPLHLVRHQVSVAIEDQAAETKVVQTFHNDTNRPLEATYVFPVPKGASVKKFVMWVNGQEVPGELVEADKARQIYTDIVRRTQDPGLLEYIGSNLLRVRVFPVPANGDQKLAISFTSIANSDAGLVEYVYPLKNDANAVHALEQFSFEATLKAQHPIQNIYSPSHAIRVNRISDHQAKVSFECKQTYLDKDFQLFYTSGSKDVGLTTMMHRPQSSQDGHFMMLISPRTELTKTQQVPRDMVFVLDTSGSMQGQRIIQARKALQFCLRNLGSKDRFAILHFATTVTKYRDTLTTATKQHLEEARQWVEELQANGGTNIDDALKAALDMQSHDSRCFTVVFFTDGQPTVGEQNPEQIVKNVVARNTANTRIFTFGVGDDVNAVLLDQLAEKTRSVSTYVRENEDIEVKVSGLYSKISNPVLTNLKLSVGKNVTLSEVYPPQLPDLFHGSQLVVLGRYHGKGHASVTLSGTVGEVSKDFVYEVQFPGQTGKDKTFVEDLWARRKVGYLLDQIRVNGNNKELVEEVVRLAKKHGITTPYTSYLVVPDTATPVAQAPTVPFTDATPAPISGRQTYQRTHGTTNTLMYHMNTPTTAVPPTGSLIGDGSTALSATNTFQPPGYQGLGGGYQMSPSPMSLPGPSGGPGQFQAGQFAQSGNPRIQFAPVFVSPTMNWAVPPALPQVPGPTPTASMPPSPPPGKSVVRGSANEEEEEATDQAVRQKLPQSASASESGCATPSTPCATPFQGYAQSGRESVDQSIELNDLRNQSQVTTTPIRKVGDRDCRNVRGVWVDEGYKKGMEQVTIKAQSPAYFRLLERQPTLSEVFRLGNRVIWVTPCGKALVIDPNAGQEEMSDEDMDRLFT